MKRFLCDLRQCVLSISTNPARVHLDLLYVYCPLFDTQKYFFIGSERSYWQRFTAYLMHSYFSSWYLWIDWKYVEIFLVVNF